MSNLRRTHEQLMNNKNNKGERYMKFYPEGNIINNAANRSLINSPSALSEAMKTGQILEWRASMCDSEHNLIVDFGFMKGIIPREEGAIGIKEGTVRDIAILSKVNRPISFIVKDFARDSSGKIIALLSRREAQLLCQEKYIDTLVCGDVIDAKVTHIEPFGVFADIGCGVISLLPIDSISVSRISHPRERFSVGMDIKVIVKKKENGRITLSQKELMGTWEENASKFKAGETVSGIVRSVESYGIFVELAPNLAGLAEQKEGVHPGQETSVFIKSILPSRMKIKLIIIETFPGDTNQLPQPEYFFQGSHMDRFIYSPESCDKQMITEFI